MAKELSAISFDHKERRDYIIVTVYQTYFFDGKKGDKIVGTKKTIIKIAKPTKSQLKKEAYK